MNKVRVDKWLWSVRIFKSRTLATDACKGGKVKLGVVAVKPSHLLSEGDTVTVKKNGFNFQFKVVSLIEKRVGAPIAVSCYEDITPQEERNKYLEWFHNPSPTVPQREKGSGRPTKKDRREMDQFQAAFDWSDDE